MPNITEEFSNLGLNATQLNPAEMELKPLTVRLDQETLCKIESLVKFTGMKNRQAVLSKIIVSGVSMAEEAFLASAPDLEEEFQAHVFHCLTEAGITQ